MMYVVGGIAIAAGLLVAVAPRIGASSSRPGCRIVVNLLTKHAPQYYDVALRDIGLMLGALTLWRLRYRSCRTANNSGTEQRNRPRRRRAAAPQDGSAVAARYPRVDRAATMRS